MIDGAVGLIVLIAAIRGAAKGIGDTVIRIAGIIGGVALGVLFSDKLSEFLKQTKLSESLHEHIFLILRGSGEENGTELLSQPGPVDETSQSVISKSLGNVIDSAADKAAEAAAERLTEIATAIIAFALIVIAIGIISMIIRHLIKRARKHSIILGFTDRTLGFALGIVCGLLIAWIAVALLLPVTAWISPENTMAMADALQQTRAAKILYDVNPFLLVIRYVLK